MSEAHVQVEDLSFRYTGRKQPALRRVSFEVPRGGSLLLLGPSGCGKSTLGLCLNGGIPHFVEGELHGSVRIGGRDTRAASMAEMAQRVGVVFQDPEAQFCMLTVEEEVAFGLENLAVPRAEMDERIDEALASVGLTGRRLHAIEHLSGGQKQRLALACVLAQRPDVLVFDEPTAQLDPAAASELIALIGRLRASRRHTLIIIEHRLDELMPLIDQVVVLDRSGEMVTAGPPRHVLREWGSWLAQAGVWVPQVAELATTLADSGLVLDPFPLTVDEAAEALGGMRISPQVPTVATGGHAEPFTSVCDLSFRYPRAKDRALDQVNLDVAPGEITAIVGANGAGKSTLARCCVGLLPTSPGHVFLEHTDISRLKPQEIARRVGYVFQYPEHQFVGRSVLEDVAFGLRRAGRPEQVAQALLEEFGLDKLAAAHPYALSHGEQRRLSVAAMLALGQQGLFLDEPTFGQDRRNAYLLFDKFTALAASGRAMTCITHDMRLVSEIAARAVVMAAGRVIFDGPPSSLFDDGALLHSAGLRPPPVTQLGQKLGLPNPILSVDELARCVMSTEMALR